MQDQQQIDCKIVSGSGVSVVHEYIAEGIDGYQIDYISPGRALFPYSPVPAFLRKTSVESVVHTIPEFGNQYIGNGKSVVTFHNYYVDSEYISTVRDVKRRLFYKTVLKKAVRDATQSASIVTTVSDYLTGLVRREISTNRPVHTIKNGIDTDKFVPATGRNWDKPRVLFAGNPIERKGIDLVYRIADQYHKGMEFWVTGGLRPTSQIDAPNVKLLGRVERQKMPELYRSVDVLLFPSSREGFGLVVAEAMASGLVVLATNGSAIPELLVDQKGGFLIDAADDGAWGRRLEMVVSSPALRDDFGAFNRARATKEFSHTRMVNEYRELFDSFD